jgi:hypothetical protein
VAWPQLAASALPPGLIDYVVIRENTEGLYASRGAGAVLREEVAADTSRRKRFLTEAKAASALNHPNVCTIYEVGETAEGQPFIAMEYVDGQSLKERLAAGALPLKEALQIAIEVTEALEAANREEGFQLRFSGDGYGPSDHTPFYGKDRPVLFFFTGLHAEYHTPSDTWETIDVPAASRLVEFIGSVAARLADAPRRPRFLRRTR